jgi:hypothetical protein
MTRFVAVYIGTATAQEKEAARSLQSDDERRSQEQALMAAWGQWMAKHQKAIVDGGAPLGMTKRASPSGVEDWRNQIVAYVIVEAATHEAAAEMFRDHPHFTFFPGNSVEIMECLFLPRADA